MASPSCEVIGCRRKATWWRVCGDRLEEYVCDEHMELLRAQTTSLSNLYVPAEAERRIRAVHRGTGARTKEELLG